MSATSRILENQRRTTLVLIDSLSSRLTPGRPYLAEIRRELSIHRGFGSRDRRVYRELIFSWLRFKPWFDAVRRRNERLAVDLLIALSPGTPELFPLQSALVVPGGLTGRDSDDIRAHLEAMVPTMTFAFRELLPAWFEMHCPALFAEEEILTQVRRPPFWLRAQRGTAMELVHELALAGIEAVASPALPGAVRVRGYVELEEHEVVRSGKAEVQDIGSQALLVMARPDPGTRWFDFCAGAGGKTLQLANLVGPKGHVTAHDVRRDALVETKRRVNRVGLKHVTIEPVLPEAGMTLFDGVLVDAPCSASGTWRRHPFLRHQLTPAVINNHVQKQVSLLEHAANFVVPGGRLIYSTCSLSNHENDGVLAAFLRRARDFRLEPPSFNPGYTVAPSGSVTLMPSVLDSDGYFLACMRRRT